MNKRKARQSGRCLCGSVRFVIAGPLRPTVIACHCRNCRRFSGGLFTVTAARKEHLVITKKGSLKWFKSSKHNKRGFCGKCGSSLFGASDQWPFVSISAASSMSPLVSNWQCTPGRKRAQTTGRLTRRCLEGAALLA
jgi:hypothetical protein